MKESAMKTYLKNYLEKKGYWVSSKEIERIDVLGIKTTDDIVAIELKGTLGDVRKGLGQAISYLEYAHNSYIAIPRENNLIDKALKICKHTNIGLLCIDDNRSHNISILKEANRNIPQKESVMKIIMGTVGVCWICGRTFNEIEPAIKYQNNKPSWIPITFQSKKELKLYAQLERYALIKDINLKNRWVGVCKVCSRIFGVAIAEYFEECFGSKKLKEYEKDFCFDNELIQKTKRQTLNYVKKKNSKEKF